MFHVPQFLTLGKTLNVGCVQFLEKCTRGYNISIPYMWTIVIIHLFSELRVYLYVPHMEQKFDGTKF